MTGRWVVYDIRIGQQGWFWQPQCGELEAPSRFNGGVTVTQWLTKQKQAHHLRQPCAVFIYDIQLRPNDCIDDLTVIGEERKAGL